MNRNRVIIAVGIAILIVIGLFAWFGGEESSEVPVAELDRPAAGEQAAAEDRAQSASQPAEADGTDREQADRGQADSGPAASGQADVGQADAGQAASSQPDDGQPDDGQPDDGRANGGQANGGQADGDAAVQRQAATDDTQAGQDAPAAPPRQVPARADAEDGADPAGREAGLRDDAPDAGTDRAVGGEVGETAAAGTARPAAGGATETAGSAEAPAGDAREITAAPDAGTAGAAAARRPTERDAQDVPQAADAAGAGALQERAADVPVGTRGPDPSAGLAVRGEAAADGGTGAGGEGAQDQQRLAALPQRQEQPAAPQPESRGTADGKPAAGRPGDTDPGADRAADGYPLPSFDIVRISRDCRAVIAGRAMPLALVTVNLGDDQLGQVTADRRGEWVLIPDGPLRPGSGEIRLSATPKDGVPVQGRQGVIVAVPDCAGGRRAEEIIALQTEDGGDRPSRILQMPGLSGEAGGLRLDTVDYDEAGKLILAGRADPRVRVNIYANNAPVGQVHSDSEGRWSLLVDDKVPLGEQMLRLDQVSERGRVQSRVEFPFSRARLSDLDLSQRNVIVQPGNSLWRIARRVYGEGLRYTVIYGANAEQIRDPDLIYPGQIFTLPQEEAASGKG